MMVPDPAAATWITDPSWMLVLAPILMWLTSPRTTQPNQIELSGPISTSPTIAAPGATKAVAVIFG